MSANLIDDTRRQLAELEAQIRAARNAPGATENMADKVRKDWEDMLRRHDEIRERLEGADSPTPQVAEGLRLDVDVLRHSFERWMSRVEGNYDNNAGTGRSKGKGGVL